MQEQNRPDGDFRRHEARKPNVDGYVRPRLPYKNPYGVLSKRSRKKNIRPLSFTHPQKNNPQSVSPPQGFISLIYCLYLLSSSFNLSFSARLAFSSVRLSSTSLKTSLFSAIIFRSSHHLLSICLYGLYFESCHLFFLLKSSSFQSFYFSLQFGYLYLRLLALPHYLRLRLCQLRL